MKIKKIFSGILLLLFLACPRVISADWIESSLVGKKAYENKDFVISKKMYM